MESSKRVFRYKLLAEDIKSKIINRTYRPEEKLPSIRYFHKRLNVSISTVYRAFVELEMMGLIEVRPRSGYYVKLLEKDLSEASENRMSPCKVVLPSFVARVLQVMNDPTFLHLGSAMISSDFLPYKYFAKILRDLTLPEMRSIISYGLSQGEYELRRQLSLRSIPVV